MCTSLCLDMSSFVLVKHTGMEWLTYGHCMFNFLRNWQFSHQRFIRAPSDYIFINTWHCQPIFTILTIRMSMQQHLILVFIPTSLMNNDIEPLFLCLLVIRISSSVKCPDRRLILTGLFVFLLLSCKIYILDTNSQKYL